MGKRAAGEALPIARPARGAAALRQTNLKFHYDDAGQLVTGTFAEHLIPTLAEMRPAIRVGHVETPSPFTEYGIEGGGEGGRMGAPGALSGAIEDALAQYGVRCEELPLTPRKVRELVRAGEKR